MPKQALLPRSLQRLGQAANQAAARQRFADYQSRRAEHTLRRQAADLALFAHFLSTLGVQPGDLSTDPFAWAGITWGLVEAFVKWMLAQGYALASVNVRLSTVKTYARLAAQAGALPPQEYALIRALQGYSRGEQRRLDPRRSVTRVGLKKSAPVKLSPEQTQALKAQPATPQGRRDRVLICLLLDHGLRAGEAAGLTVEDLDLARGFLRFFRPKVGKRQTHRLSADTLAALRDCQAHGELPASGALLRRVLKNGAIGKDGLTPRGISLRVAELGQAAGVAGLSAHDLRHAWASAAAARGVDPFALQEAGGWSSLAMPRRYVEEGQVANEKLLDDQD